MTRAKVAVITALVILAVTQIPLQQHANALLTQEQAYANMQQALNELMAQIATRVFRGETQEQIHAETAPYDQAAVAAMKDYAAFLPREQAEQLYNAISQAEAEQQQQQQTTEDDGYLYPHNATEEEKAAIDKQELQAWEDAGRPGELLSANTIIPMAKAQVSSKAYALTSDESRERHIYLVVTEEKDKQIRPVPGWDAVALTQKILEEERILGIQYDDFRLQLEALQEIADLQSRAPESALCSDLSKMMGFCD